ncbi:ferritin-like domain-containing protein [Streptomyces sp. NRRL S-87]|uniref:ferritin-like domain-containing protein n=1 Tax=Streptomyces sp. NRRL S-87 TaxID=1463920 RepID=UPI0004BF6623|nr:ferritin-like domain-containing protein [Streptomyces sp. NRRL S-87]
MPDLPTPAGKILPRNLTARADHVVRGNPANSRPESGVDNCFPGLEFDQRNLDKAFFPGMLFDFHRYNGSRALEVTGGVAAAEGLTTADLTGDNQVFIGALCGRTRVDQTDAHLEPVDCRERDGLDVWRQVHDLLPGRIAVLLLGRQTSVATLGAAAVGNLNTLRMRGESFVRRAPDGRFQLAVLVADRARYLDENGVIDPEAYGPGDLTRSLCAPWQYDFRDCGCFYWAASKPDVASNADESIPQMNFLRADRTPVPDLDTDARDLGSPRRRLEFGYARMISDWSVLPVVLNGREDDGIGNPAPPDVPLLDRATVISRLKGLATVEHALSVEYLYAHYTLNAPRELPDTASRLMRRIHAAAFEVFEVAVDEMRHLRWVNEALGTLGEKPVVGRAAEIVRDTVHPFELRPLTPAQLQWFIDVEAPSQQVGTGLDGMYVQLHRSIVKQPDVFPEADRLAHLIKLVIDEGEEHFRRFTAVKQHLAGLDPLVYLRTLRRPGAQDRLGRLLLDLSDLYYAALLGTLRATFALGDQAGGLLIGQARVTMENLHEINHLLASRGIAPRFTLPPAFGPDAGGLPPELANGQATREAAVAAIRALSDIGELDGDLRDMANSQQIETAALLDVLDLQA